MQNIYLFRHGQTDWNIQKRFQGHSNIGLNEEGRNQANRLSNYLKDFPIQVVYTSDLDRAVETAEIVAKHNAIPVIKSEKLREAHLGEAEGLVFSEIENRFGVDAIDKWKSTELMDFSFPKGEKKSSMLKRVRDYFDDALASSTYKHNIAFSTHGAVIHKLVYQIMGSKYQDYPVTNCSLFVFLKDSDTIEFVDYKNFV